MLPCNPGGHAAFQDTFVSRFLKFYPDPFVLPKSTWDYIVQFCGAACLRNLPFMPSSAVSLLAIPLVSGLFMISFPASGRMTPTTFPQKTGSLK